MSSRRRRTLALLPALALTATGLTGLAASPGAAADGDLTLRGSVNQLYVLDAEPGADLELVSGATVVGTGEADEMGSLAWRELDAGTYTVRYVETPASSATATVTDFDDPDPAQSFYDAQTLDEGFGYITTRDGTTLSANVVFPTGDGPYPTVVEYSGYDPSNPANTTMAQLFTNLGFAYVGVNIRGTGCSGGSFLNFEPVQSLDGYDAIEAVAAQPWAKFHRAGMVGISYPGISQLYVARTQPPHLSAITPLSVIDDTYRGTLYPGGILNTGFAVPWAAQRAAQAAPYGEGWEQPRVDAGDTECAANQRLRLQNPDPLALIEDNPYYDDRWYEPLNQGHFVDDITVPVFLAGSWQDEQTGGHFPAFLDDFTSSPHVYATMVNGSHTESLSLGVFGRYADFLDLYVGRRVPGYAKVLVAPVLAGSITGVTGQSLPQGQSYDGMTFRQALRTYEKAAPVRVLFEEGAADGKPAGAPLPRYEAGFSAWPVPEAKARTWWLGAGGALRNRPAMGSHAARDYAADPTALPTTNYTGSSSGIWKADPDYDWRQIPAGTGLGWITAPLEKTMVAVGNGALDLWVRSDAADTDLEVTVSEVRPDGTEVYVQSGWLRTSHRALDRDASTRLAPVHTNRAEDAAPLPAGEFTRVRVGLFPFAHAFRKGTQLRITVDAPGNARPLWAFDTISAGERVWVATDAGHRSRLSLPLVAGIDVPKKAPDCEALRSQPCRTYPGV